MTPEVTDFIPVSLEDTDKFIEVADGHHITAKHKGPVRIQMWDDNGKKIYASIARMSSDDERESKEYGDSSQLTNWILDSGATCHMTPEVTDFIPGSLEDTDKFIEVADGHHITAKHKGPVRIH